jgi:hypothetical protein
MTTTLIKLQSCHLTAMGTLVNAISIVEVTDIRTADYRIIRLSFWQSINFFS